MSYRIAISFAAAAIGMSCIASDASARGGGSGGGHAGGPAMGFSERPGGVGGPNGGGGPSGGGGWGGGGAAAGAGYYYSPAQYNSSAACGRYPYPPCKRVPTR
jgi:hypothetical protein